MKLSDLFCRKNRKQENTSVTVEQHGDNSNAVIGDVSNSNIGCTIFNYNNLEPQWINRLETYTKTLHQFKPQTALSLLEELENSFSTSQQKPSKELCSQISYQKGICYRFLDNKDKMCECFITAYTNNNLNAPFEEQAALSYFKIEETEKANKLVNNLLQNNEFNPVAWYIKFLSDTTLDFDSIPKFVKKNMLFQQMLYNYFNFKKQFDNISKMKELSMFPDSKNYKQQNITINNFDESIFYTNVFFADYIEKHCFHFHCFNDGNIDILNVLNQLLNKIITVIKGSELESKYTTLFFIYAYVQYALTKDKQHIAEMQSFFSKLTGENEILTLLCANTLQLNDQTDKAIEILNNPKLNQPNIFFLKAYCFIKKNDYVQYGKSIKEWINSIDQINDILIEEYLRTIFNIKLFGENEEIKLSDFIQNDKFENEQYKLLVVTVVNSLVKNEIEGQELSNLSNLVSNIQQPKLLLYIADTYDYCKKYELAIALYEEYADKENENRHLLNYIYSLNSSNKNSDELLILLEKWRLKYSFQPDLHRIEADLCGILHDWQKCLQICNSFLDKYPQDEPFLTLKLKCLDLINEDWCDKDIKLLSQVFANCSLSISKNIPLIATTFVNHGYYQEGFDMFYKYQDKIEVRSAFIPATLPYSQQNKSRDLLKDYEEIIDDCWVKYEINNEIHFHEMNNNSDTLYNHLLGHKVGDMISVKGTMANKNYSIRILRIMDKYLYLHDKILEEAKQPQILSGLPMESFSFSSTEPQKMMEELISLFGKNGEEEKVKRETAFRNYYNRTLSFSEIIIQIYRNDYLGGYANLIHEQSGISILPLSLYQSLPQQSSTTPFVIDFSSLVILHKIEKEHNIVFPNKFLISTFIVDMIKQKLRTVKEEPKSEMSLDVTTEGVAKYQIPENMQQSNIAYLESLLKWIEVNCESVVSTRVIEFKRNLTLEHKQEGFIDYILNTILIREDKQGILLTDDTVYIKFNILPLQFTISTEKYVKDNLGDNTPALYEFIKNKYKGFTISTKQLVDEFNKKSNSQDNFYTNCLENVSIVSSLPCIDFIRVIVKSQLDLEQKRIEIRDILFNLLKNGPLNSEVIQSFEMLLYVDFYLSPEEYNFVRGCLQEVYKIIGIEFKATK
ncbi:MAG: hypothetical protein LBH32_10695 [Dysgonamonadaceae bacterium]|jgi:hypothetical protein|nr:hypothetical protein [Dysgonamonadaceae bacterium]